MTRRFKGEIAQIQAELHQTLLRQHHRARQQLSHQGLHFSGETERRVERAAHTFQIGDRLHKQPKRSGHAQTRAVRQLQKVGQKQGEIELFQGFGEAAGNQRIQLALELLPVHLHPAGCRSDLFQQIGGPGTILIDQCKHQIQQIAASARVEHADHAGIEQHHAAIAQHLQIPRVGIGMEKPLHEVLLYEGSQKRRGGRANPRPLAEGEARLVREDGVTINPLQHQHPLTGKVLHHLGQAQLPLGNK